MSGRVQSWVGRLVPGGSATLPARSAPCQTPGCSSPTALRGSRWCGCSGPLHRTPVTQQFADGTSRSRQQSAPPAPGPSPWQQSEWAGGRYPLGRRWMSGLVYIIHFLVKSFIQVNRIPWQQIITLTFYSWGFSSCKWKKGQLVKIDRFSIWHSFELHLISTVCFSVAASLLIYFLSTL